MSLTCSHQTLVLFSSNPPHTRLPKPYLFPTTSLLKLPPTLFRNGSTSVTHRNNRFQLHANSSDSDERQQVKPSSTSLLSFLCPLLKLFSVSFSSPLLIWFKNRAAFLFKFQYKFSHCCIDYGRIPLYWQYRQSYQLITHLALEILKIKTSSYSICDERNSEEVKIY